MNDVPAHCKFLQRYGGTDHKFLMDMLAYLDTAMPEGRIVSGNFLDKLATLKLAPKEMLPRVAHACVIVQACGEKERESVGSTLNEGHVKSLTTSRKAAALQGEGIMRRAYEMVESMEPNRALTDGVGKLMQDIVLHIFELSDTYESMDDILTVFLGSIGLGVESQAAPAAANGPKPAHAMPNEVRYTSDGNDAGRITANNMGFSIGAVIEPKKVNEDEDEQYLIKYVNDDGSVGAQRILPDGTEDKKITIIDIDNLITNHRHVQRRLSLLEGYPKSAAIDGDDFKASVLRGAVSLAVRRLSKDDSYTKISFRVQKHPKERLFALDSAEKGYLRVVPVTHKLAVPDPSACGASADMAIADGVKCVLQRNVSPSCASEFFVMRIVHEEKKANVKIRVFKEKVDGVDVGIPCALNFKPIVSGEEVVLFKPAPAKAAPKAKVVAAMLEPPAKKAKTAWHDGT